MTASRGDRKACTHADCAGTMQFGRELLATPSSSRTKHEGDRGWVCSVEPRHFERASHQPLAKSSDSGTLQPGWDDDGGALRSA